MEAGLPTRRDWVSWGAGAKSEFGVLIRARVSNPSWLGVSLRMGVGFKVGDGSWQLGLELS